MTAEYNETNHLLIWDTSNAGPKEDPGIAYLGNLLAAPRFWAVDGKRATTRNLVSGVETKGLPRKGFYFVGAFLVLKGSAAQAFDLAKRVDWDFVGRFALNAEQNELLEAFATMSVLPVRGADASAALLWCKNSTGTVRPDFPSDMVMEIINGYNVWSRYLKAEGHHLDSARLNVRFETFHLAAGALRHGRETAGRLAAVGTFPRYEVKIEEAVKLSGLDTGRYVFDIARGNGWWSALSDVPEFYDHPISAVLG